MGKKLSTDEVYDVMKRRIIELDYEPGLVLNEVEVAEEFDMSRTPIRKVFQQLSNDNLLNIVPRFGAQVAPIDFMYMKSVFEVTRVLDPFAAKLAVNRIEEKDMKELEEIVDRLKGYNIEEDYKEAIKDDERFHKILTKSSANPSLQEILGNLHNHTERLWHYSKRFFDEIDLFVDSLNEILIGIKNKDEDRAEEGARIHIDEFVNKIKEELL